jgi:hypothetical protein
MQPRIYVYIVKFEEIPDWYWGVHKEKKFEEFYLGSPVTNAWKWDFYTPHLKILQEFEYSEEGWKEALNLEERLIRPDLNNPLCLNEGVGGKCSIRVHQETGRKVFDPSYEKSINNRAHPSYGKGGKIGGKKACDPNNPRSINNPNHPSYHVRNQRNGERAIKTQGKRVRMKHLASGFEKEYPSIRSAAKDLNLLQGALTNLLNPNHPSKTYKGFTGEKL